MSFVRSYVVPEGFPDSVIPSYVPYMTWRALKVQFQFLCGYLLGIEVSSCVELRMLMLSFTVAFLWGCNECFYHSDASEFSWGL